MTKKNLKVENIKKDVLSIFLDLISGKKEAVKEEWKNAVIECQKMMVMEKYDGVPLVKIVEEFNKVSENLDNISMELLSFDKKEKNYLNHLKQQLHSSTHEKNKISQRLFDLKNRSEIYDEEHKKFISELKKHINKKVSQNSIDDIVQKIIDYPNQGLLNKVKLNFYMLGFAYNPKMAYSRIYKKTENDVFFSENIKLSEGKLKVEEEKINHLSLEQSKTKEFIERIEAKTFYDLKNKELNQLNQEKERLKSIVDEKIKSIIEKKESIDLIKLIGSNYSNINRSRGSYLSTNYRSNNTASNNDGLIWNDNFLTNVIILSSVIQSYQTDAEIKSIASQVLSTEDKYEILSSSNDPMFSQSAFETADKFGSGYSGYSNSDSYSSSSYDSSSSSSSYDSGSSSSSCSCD